MRSTLHSPPWDTEGAGHLREKQVPKPRRFDLGSPPLEAGAEKMGAPLAASQDADIASGGAEGTNLQRRHLKQEAPHAQKFMTFCHSDVHLDRPFKRMLRRPATLGPPPN